VSVFQLLARTALQEADASNALGEWILGLPVGGYEPDEVRQRVAVALLTLAEDIFYRILQNEPEIQRRAPTPAALAALGPSEVAALDRRLHGYVRRSLQNTLQTVRRKAEREVLLRVEDLEARATAWTDPVDLLEVRETAASFEALRAGLPEATLREVEQMEALKEREIEMDVLVRADLAERGLEPTESAWRGSRNRIYKRHDRARERVERRISAMWRDGRIPEVHVDELIAWVQSLRRRINRGSDVS